MGFEPATWSLVVTTIRVSLDIASPQLQYAGMGSRMVRWRRTGIWRGIEMWCRTVMWRGKVSS